MYIYIYSQFSQITIFKFLSQNSPREKMTKITLFYFENFNFIFLKFETLSPKFHPLTLNPKFRLVNSSVKIHFYPLIKLILVIFFIEDYFCDKNLKNAILGNFSIYYRIC